MRKMVRMSKKLLQRLEINNKTIVQGDLLQVSLEEVWSLEKIKLLQCALFASLFLPHMKQRDCINFLRISVYRDSYVTWSVHVDREAIQNAVLFYESSTNLKSFRNWWSETFDVGNVAWDNYFVYYFGEEQSGKFAFSRKEEHLKKTCNGPKAIVSEPLFY